MEELLKKEKDLDIENFILVIFIIITLLELISNFYEEDFYKTKNKSSKKTYKKINIFVISVTLLINIYYFISSYKNISKKNSNIYEKLAVLSTSLLVLSSIISLYIELNDKDIDFEVPFI